MTSRCRVTLIALVVAFAACRHDETGAGSRRDPAHASARGDRPLELPPGIPATAVIVGAAELPADWLASAGSWGLLDAETTRAAMADLDTYVTRTTGLSLGKLHRAAMFVTGDGKPAVWIGDVGGTWKGPVPHDVKVVTRGKWLLVGEPSAVDLAIAAADGKSPRLAADAPLARLFAKESKGAYVAVAIDVGGLPAEARAGAAAYGVERAAVALGASFHAVAEGKAQGLAKLVSLYDAKVGEAVAQLEAARKAALDHAEPGVGPDPEAVGAILGAHLARAWTKRLRPTLAGDALRLDLALPAFDASTSFAMIGVLAAVAVPSFVEYKRRAEALQAQVPSETEAQVSPEAQAQTIAKLRELRDAMCACKDPACARQVYDEVDRWTASDPHGFDARQSPEGRQLGDGLTACATTALAARAK